MPQLNDCSVQGKSEDPCACLCVLFVKSHEQWFPDEAFTALLGKHDLLGPKMLMESVCLEVINLFDFKVHFAEMTLLSIRSCQHHIPKDISRESSEEEKMTSSAAEMGWAPGT